MSLTKCLKRLTWIYSFVRVPVVDVLNHVNLLPSTVAAVRALELWRDATLQLSMAFKAVMPAISFVAFFTGEQLF